MKQAVQKMFLKLNIKILKINERLEFTMLNKKTIEDIAVAGKKVLVRCDFNVPLDENKTLNVDASGFTVADELIVSTLVKAAKPIDNPITTNSNAIRMIFLFFLDFSIVYLLIQSI